MDEQTEAYLEHEDIQDQMEQSEDAQDQYQDNQFDNQFSGAAEAPYQKKPESLYTLFQKVWAAKNSSKVGNLDKFELGQMPIKVRDAQYLYLLANTLNHKQFGDFWQAQSEIILSTSASKKGWFTELFVSQKKFTARSASVNSQQQANKKKWTLFGAGQTAQDQSE
ncbi:MAG: hypothetical protein ACHQ1D_00910 [Nitrososphaerales archaeon]